MTGLTHHAATPSSPERAVVVGARGFVGNAILRELSAHRIPCLGIASTDIDLLAPAAEAALAAQLRSGDALMVVSALTPDRGKDIATFMKNLRMMETVCAALAKQPVQHVVNIGSDAVYADSCSLIDESTALAPSGFHGMMHAAREMMLQTTVKAPLALLRPSLLYGGADTHNGYGPNRFRRTAAAERRITLFGGGEEKRDHVYIRDVATLVRLVLERRSAGALNIATGTAASFREAADLVAGQFLEPITIVEQPRATPITHRHFHVATRLRAFPDFYPTPLADGLAAAHREASHG